MVQPRLLLPPELEARGDDAVFNANLLLGLLTHSGNPIDPQRDYPQSDELAEHLRDFICDLLEYIDGK